MIVAAALSLVVAPAFADKPADVLGAAKPIKITAIPIDFDRDNPERKEFGKLIWRGGLNLFATRFFWRLLGAHHRPVRQNDPRRFRRRHLAAGDHRLRRTQDERS
jgi:hypothetical protein